MIHACETEEAVYKARHILRNGDQKYIDDYDFDPDHVSFVTRFNDSVLNVIKNSHFSPDGKEYLSDKFTESINYLKDMISRNESLRS